EGRYTEALRAHAKALAIRERIGDPLGIGTSRNNLAQIELARGALDEAEADFTAALKRWSAIGYAAGIALARTGLGITAVRRGEIPDSLAALERSREILRATSERQELARTLAGLARALRALPPDDARRSEADQLVSEAAGIFRELGAELDLGRLPAG